MTKEEKQIKTLIEHINSTKEWYDEKEAEAKEEGNDTAKDIWHGASMALDRVIEKMSLLGMIPDEEEEK